jgi:hypothetical protein
MSDSSVGFIDVLPLLIVILIPILIFIGLCVLEFFLARKERKIYGLILPIVSFGVALIITLFTLINMTGGLWTILAGVLLVGLFANIPTVIFLIIFFIARTSKKSGIGNKEIEKMNIMDLE